MGYRTHLCGVLCCVIGLAVLGSTAYAGPEVHLNTEAEWAAAIGSRISPLTPGEWLGLDSNFRTNMGTGTFVTSTLWASAGGHYESGETEFDLMPGMGMQWAVGAQPDQSTSYIGGWKYVYGQDPNLQGQTISMHCFTPMISPATGFVINTLGIGLMDINGKVRSWTYNCGPVGGNGALPWNAPSFLQIVVSGIGLGAAGDAGHGGNPPPGPFPFDLAAFADNGFDPTLTTWIIGIENGVVPPGGTLVAPPPGGAANGPFNWWGVDNVTPEPATMGLLTLGLCGLLTRRRGR